MRTQRNLGTRCVCSSCDTKYYDLGKDNPSCPRCGAPAHGEDANPRATAMARIKAEGPRKRTKAEDEDLPFGLGKSPDAEDEEEEEEEEMEELGDLTEETSSDTGYDYN